VHPVEGSLYVRQTGLQGSNQIGVGRYAEAEAIYHAGKAHARARQDVNVSAHSGFDVLELAFPEITDCPPNARVDERKNSFAHMRVGPF